MIFIRSYYEISQKPYNTFSPGDSWLGLPQILVQSYVKACLCILGVHRFCDIPKSYCLLYDKVLHFENCHPLSRALQNATQMNFVIFSKDMISQPEISSLKARLKAVSLKKKKTSPKLNRQILCIFTSCQVLLHPKVGQKKFQCFFPFFHFFV